MARSRLHRRYGRRRHRSESDGGYRGNPPLFTELAEYIVPGFAGFASTRLLTRIVSVGIAKRKPSLGKHAGVLASVGSFLAVWLLAHRWKPIAPYQSPLAVGAGLATLQTLIQTYLPQIGWIVADASPEVTAASAPLLNDRDFELTDEDPTHFTYDDRFDQGRMGRPQHRADARAAAQPSAPADDPDADLLSELDLDATDATGAAIGGIFSN